MGYFPLDMFQLTGCAQRPHLGFLRQWVTYHDPTRQRDHPCQELIRDVLMQIKPRSRDTALTRSAKNARDRGVHGAFNIRVFKNDERRFAAQLQ